MKIKRLILVVKTAAKAPDGTEASLFLIANSGGHDVVYEEIASLAAANGLTRTYANIFEVPLDDIDKDLTVDDSTYFRVALGSRKGGLVWTYYYIDAWHPERMLLWGLNDKGEFVPLAYSSKPDERLAETNLSRVSVPLRRCTELDVSELIDQLVLVVKTETGAGWKAIDPVTVSLSAANESEADKLLFRQPLNDPDSFDLTTGYVNLYPLMPSNLAKQHLSGGRIEFSLESNNKDNITTEWEPEWVYLFGISSSGGTFSMGTILAYPNWKDGKLCADRPCVSIQLPTY